MEFDQTADLLEWVNERFSALVQTFHPQDRQGNAAVSLFLEQVLCSDSCSPRVREAFVQAFRDRFIKEAE